MINEKNMISVIVPVYKVERYITNCIQSLICQTFKKLQILIADDGSTDYSSEICDKFSLMDKRIIVVHKKNGGVSSARNVGLDLVAGEYVSFIDGDDIWDENYCKILLEKIETAQADMIRCDDKGISPDGMVLSKPFRFEEIYLDKNDSKHFEYPWYRLSCCALLFRKNLLFKNDDENIKFRIELSFGEDGVFLTELLNNLNFGAIYTPLQLYFIVYHNDSARNNLNNSLLKAFEVRQKIVSSSNNINWITFCAKDFLNHSCMDYLSVLRENNYKINCRLKKIHHYIFKYKRYNDDALGKGIKAKISFMILCFAPRIYNLYIKFHDKLKKG